VTRTGEDPALAKPVGVTIIAIVFFLESAFVVLLGIRLARSGLITTSYSGSSGLPELVAAAIVLAVVFSALYALAGWGLWKLKNWGRLLAVALQTIGSAVDLLRWVFTKNPSMSKSFATVITLALYGAVVWYLTKKDVKAAFSPRQAGGRMAENQKNSVDRDLESNLG
jgi:hypothetical protein